MKKIAKGCVFPMVYGSGGPSRRLAKAAGTEPFRQRRNKNLHAAVPRGAYSSQNVQVRMSKNCTALWREEQFSSQNAQNISASDRL